ncbi:MAG: toll/interleukin-1 receptor domain-containing protein, partial [Ignavibacteriales bacterium]
TSVTPDSSFIINVWAHLEQQRREVLDRAREFSTDGGIKIQSKGPFKVARGILLTIRMELAGLILEDPVDTILWEGEIGNATFFATIPRKYNQGTVNGRAMVYIEGLQIAKIPFLITVTHEQSTELTQTEVIRHRTAFASYASGDQDDVLARIHGIQKAVPELEIFFDKKSLRSGQQWEQELWRVIEGSDVFYLFWSKNASQSEWVEKEWRYALTTRGLDFIDPVPLASPQIAPPPKELEKLHFNDWVLSFINKG